MLTMRHIASLSFLALLCSGCSQNLLTKQDYENSRAAFARGDVKEALAEFPRGAERGDFITTMEKGYLSLLQGEPAIDGLRKQDAALEQRVRYHVSREARSFFYVQTPEDYYAAEHEVIWLHFLLSWGYSLQGKYEDGCVEAREASTLLEQPWSPNGHFDDPAMRLFLGALWTMCGDWREARVDFRAAHDMDPGLAWAGELAQRDKPPAQLFAVLGGLGPEPEWNPSGSGNILRAARQVRFTLAGAKSDLTMRDGQGRAIRTHLSPDAGNWYARQMARESELHELILDSAYGGRATASGAWAGTKIAATGTAGTAVAVAGIAAGVVICAAAIQSASSSAGDACGIGLGLAVGGYRLGTKIAREGYEQSTREFKEEMDPTPTYRFVRYLPEYLWLAWSDKPVVYPVRLATAGGQAVVSRPGAGKGSTVNVLYIPDVPYASYVTNAPCWYPAGNSLIATKSMREASGSCPDDPAR